ncbi:IS200/IS605 family transposase [Actinobacillus pleuropneumoniae]|uniref:IS200/IS605 family transposase n=1 Tax=Actinobacillus pleuropneumoniae TaxID=715 RepID=UPI001EEF1CBF|nr:IS200/IS605 family transposase [Actinobacillus pleuropneumoniae]UKH21127.1 IS200/IS605 family transposase [Actinobacillus pleuropneumoniae]UPA20867.1 IS200/IS605 family transposase [Actinobacillus pleuropneumoniae]
MSYTRLFYHIVFRTLQSVPAINEENEKELYQYIWAFCQQQKCTLHHINGMPDHLHLLVEIHPSMAVADFVKQLKNASHKWLEHHSDLFPDFYAWSKGYCALSYSEHEIGKIINYIKGQKEHHKTWSFVDEMKALLGNVNEYLEQDL